MALNKNHEFEELDGVKCGIVEKNVKPERVSFLKELLEFNGYTVVVVSSPAPKAAPAPKPAEARPDDPVGRVGTPLTWLHCIPTTAVTLMLMMPLY